MVYLSGIVWFVIGLGLMSLGMHFLIGAMTALNDGTEKLYPIVQSMSLFLGGEEMTALLFILCGCCAGYLKGAVVLSKAVLRGVSHIRALSEPAPLSRIYPARYYLLLVLMMGLGFLAKLLPLDLRGFVDVAIGSALIHGGIQYFRVAFHFQESVRAAS